MSQTFIIFQIGRFMGSDRAAPSLSWDMAATLAEMREI